MSKRKSEKTIPFTIEAVLDFVSKHDRISIGRLKGSRCIPKKGSANSSTSDRLIPEMEWLCTSAASELEEMSILIERDGKDYLEVFKREEGEKEMRRSLLGIIERDELTSDLEEVSMETLFAILSKHVDLESLSGWVAVTSNQGVRIAAASEQEDFWKLWNHLGLKPKVTLKDRSKISPSFTAMKRLQVVRFASLSSDLAGALLGLLNGDFLSACEVILQECRSFDWPSVVENLVTAIGGVEGWMGQAAEVSGGLVFCPIK